LIFLIKEIKANLSSPLKLVISGGEAPMLMKFLKIEAEYRPHMVLEGLMYYAHEKQTVLSA